MIDLEKIVGFDWDEGNSRKSSDKHDVIQSEAEQIFFNQPLILLDDEKHSGGEIRYIALGKTDAERRLGMAFTLRGNLIRVVSVRPMSRSERRLYEKEGA